MVDLNNAIINEEKDVDLVDSTPEIENHNKPQREGTGSESTNLEVEAEKENRECNETKESMEKEENFYVDTKKSQMSEEHIK